MKDKKKILFFFVHPSKYHLFKHTVNYLKNNGYEIDIAIVTKDVLEDLIKNEGWEYTNIIPEGRRSKVLNPKLAVLYFVLKTLFKLWLLTGKKKYDLYISDDLLPVIGKIRRVKSILFVDDDIAVVPEIKPILMASDSIIAPDCTDLENFNHKKIAFNSYKELSYLHPDKFKPNYDIVKNNFPPEHKYTIIRLVSLSATHDINNKIQGINDEKLSRLISVLEQYGDVYISSEREIPKIFSKYLLKIKPNDILHYLYYARILITDSQTMSSEACVLATPVIRISDFKGRISVMEEKENKYGLMFSYKFSEFDSVIEKANELLQIADIKQIWKNKVDIMLNDKVDLNEFLIKTIVAKI